MGVENLTFKNKITKPAFCPSCESRYSYARRKTADRVCRRCSCVFRVRPDGTTEKVSLDTKA
jgi:hypothetical protein